MISVSAATPLLGLQVHPSPVRSPGPCGDTQNDRSSGVAPRNTALCEVDASCSPGDHSYSWPCEYAPGTGALASSPRRLVAVTVALSEPADTEPLDWAETIAANLRLLYRNTTVEVIDSWRVDA